jgi:hypothetical protein
MVLPAQLVKLGNTSTTILARSVGRGGHNNPIDVAIVQNLLNTYFQSSQAAALFQPAPFFQPTASFQPALSFPSGPVFPSATLSSSPPPPQKFEIDGETGPELFDAITAFQRAVMKTKQPDGRIDPGGKTIAALKGYLPGDFLPSEFQSPTTASWHMSTERFASLYTRYFGQLTAPRLAGLKSVFDNILYDEDVYDVRWGAYMLATIKHETGHTFLPIEEDEALWSQSTGAGKYAEAITITDETGTSVTNRYYGRGYVQLTWPDKYRSLGQRLGLGRALEYHPEKALDADTAYAIASIGMREGLFRSPNTLEKYIHGAYCDYYLARYIINGDSSPGKPDAADRIEKYAIAFECLMLLSKY